MAGDGALIQDMTIEGDRLAADLGLERGLGCEPASDPRMMSISHCRRKAQLARNVSNLDKPAKDPANTLPRSCFQSAKIRLLPPLVLGGPRSGAGRTSIPIILMRQSGGFPKTKITQPTLSDEPAPISLKRIKTPPWR